MSVSNDLCRNAYPSRALSDTSDTTFAYTRHARACARAIRHKPNLPSDVSEHHCAIRSRRQRVSLLGQGDRIFRAWEALTALRSTYTKNLWNAVGLIFNWKINPNQSCARSVAVRGRGDKIFATWRARTAYGHTERFFLACCEISPLRWSGSPQSIGITCCGTAENEELFSFRAWSAR
jgi:hypothetical protein